LFIGTWELVLIILVIVLIFGGKKIPELMKGVGKGVKSFKEGMNEIDDQVNQADASKAAPKSDETPKAE
jgi:sec-independent protein translocase protein TatA